MSKPCGPLSPTVMDLAFWHRKSDAPPALSPTRYSAFFEFRSPLDMRHDVQEILRATPHHKQVMIFSATLAKEIPGMCKKLMANQYYVKLEETGKNRKLNELLDTLEFN
ncbi:hypothetical protein C8R44DRAFT_878787 [Mycena epipterygia]|nr:hypothetical protein C8R44DRAFT_878787 [Mycena epipterygia]